MFRHPDKRRISKGICLKNSPSRCDTHDECIGSGGKCCNGFCCNDVYFNAIKELPCLNDEGCQVSIRIFPGVSICSKAFYWI